MNKKGGFTLIELLAVIVILAIIAVIAVPIVLNIIDETKKNAGLRSAEMYVKAAELSIANSTLKDINIPDDEYTIKDGDICLNDDCTDKLDVEVNGEVPKEGTITITNGNISDLSIVLNEKTIVKNSAGDLVYQETPSGPTQIYKPQYYYFIDFDLIGEIFGNVGETVAPVESERLIAPQTGNNFYLGYDVLDGVVSTAYACFVRNEIEYCLKPNDLSTSIEIIKAAFSDVVDTDVCVSTTSSISCREDDLDYNDFDDYYYSNYFSASTSSNGDIWITDGTFACFVNADGSFATYKP